MQIAQGGCADSILRSFQALTGHNPEQPGLSSELLQPEAEAVLETSWPLFSSEFPYDPTILRTYFFLQDITLQKYVDQRIWCLTTSRVFPGNPFKGNCRGWSLHLLAAFCYWNKMLQPKGRSKKSLDYFLIQFLVIRAMTGLRGSVKVDLLMPGLYTPCHKQITTWRVQAENKWRWVNTRA